MPSHVPAPPRPTEGEAGGRSWELLDILEHWRLVEADLVTEFGVDLWDPAVRARPWPGIRTMIFSLLDSPTTRLRRALTRR